MTITLDGTAETVALSGAGSNTLSQTAHEIADHDYGSVGNRGWDAFAIGTTVIFRARDTGDKSSTFSFVDTDTTGVTGSFAETVAGVVATADWTAQTDWNIDKANNTGALPTIDFTKGNVFAIRFQFLGFGAIQYFIEHPTTGQFCLVHINRYANTNTRPSLNDPSMPLCIEAANSGNTSSLTVKSASVGS